MREQERRKRQAISRADGVKNRILGRMRDAELLAKEGKRRGDEMKKEMTEDTGAGADMKEHADRKVRQMENELLGD